MSAVAEAIAIKWQHAVHMPKIDHDLKEIVVVPFDVSFNRRLGQLQAEMKRLNYV